MERPIWWAFGIVALISIAGVVAWLKIFKPFDKRYGEPLGFWFYLAWVVINLVCAYWLYIGF